MSVNLIAFPFRVAPNGSVFTQLDGSDEYYAGELTMLVSTVPGERIVVPTYGVNDPTFNEFPTAVLMSAVETFGPPVDITDVIITRKGESSSVDVIINFEQASEDGPSSDQANLIGE